jgi:hypothetical protein
MSHQVHELDPAIYQTAEDGYLATLSGGAQLMRASLVDLAEALRARGLSAENLLFGDWRVDAQLLEHAEQHQSIALMRLDRT